MASAAFEEIAETFEFLEDWEERYRHVIELGKAMAPLDYRYPLSLSPWTELPWPYRSLLTTTYLSSQHRLRRMKSFFSETIVVP